MSGGIEVSTPGTEGVGYRRCGLGTRETTASLSPRSCGCTVGARLQAVSRAGRWPWPGLWVCASSQGLVPARSEFG